MAKANIAHPAHETTTRIDCGRTLYAEHADEITYKEGSWHVPSATVEGRFYAVRLGPVETCECPNHEHRGSKCMHVTAATIAKAKSTVCSCSGQRVPRKFVTEVHEEHGLLAWFVGDRICADCVRGGFWS